MYNWQFFLPTLFASQCTIHIDITAILKLSVQNTALCFLFKINSCTSLIYCTRIIICKIHTKVCLARDETGQAGDKNIILNVQFASSDFLRLSFCINGTIQRRPKRILELTLQMDGAFGKHTGFVQFDVTIFISRNFPIYSSRWDIVFHLPEAKHLKRQIFDKLTGHLKM